MAWQTDNMECLVPVHARVPCVCEWMHADRSEDHVWSWVSSLWQAGIEVRWSGFLGSCFCPLSHFACFFMEWWLLHFLCAEVLEHSDFLSCDKDVWDGQVKGRRVYYGCWFQSIVLSGKASCHDRPGNRETGIRTFTFPPLRCLGLRRWDDPTHVQLVLETHTKCTQRFDSSSRRFWVQPRWLEISHQILLHVLENYGSGLLCAMCLDTEHWTEVMEWGHLPVFLAFSYFPFPFPPFPFTNGS